MGWSFRKSLRVVPGVRINLSKRGPSLSVGLPGIRASVNARGQARLNASAGPLRYQKQVTIASSRKPEVSENRLIAWIRSQFPGGSI